jgi:Mg2+/Co2+ transporter CorC
MGQMLLAGSKVLMILKQFRCRKLHLAISVEDILDVAKLLMLLERVLVAEVTSALNAEHRLILPSLL